MQKLLTACQDDPTPANVAKLFAYMRKHPMAICMVTKEQSAFVQILREREGA